VRQPRGGHNVSHGAERIRRGADRKQPRPGRERLFERGPIQLTRGRAERHGLHHQTCVTRNLPPRIHVRVVIELGDDDLVAFAPAPRQRPRQMERQGRHVGAEGDLVGRRVEKVGERGARSRNQRIGFDAGRIGPVRVGVVVQQVLAHRVSDRRGHLGASRPVEIGNREPVVET
jgi:hypothetical protein